MWKRCLSLVVSIVPLSSTACSDTADAPSGDRPYKACVAFDVGGIGDMGFNDLAKKGLDDAAAAGYATAFGEAQGSDDYTANIERLVDQGCRSIITVGFNQVQATMDATLEHPDIAFAAVDATWLDGEPPANFTGIDFRIDEASMLAGYLAAGFSKTGKIGTYGGLQFPGVTRFMDGLYAGVRFYDADHAATVEVLGWDAATQTGTFVGGDNPRGDPAKGEDLAASFVAQGVDIIHPVAGATGNGSIKYMAEHELYAIGVDTDQAVTLAEYAGALLTSSQKRIDVAVLATIEANAAGHRGGDDFVGTLANGGVALAPFHDLAAAISSDLAAGVTALEAKLVAGDVKVSDYLR